LKKLEQIPEPFYTKVKTSILNLSKNPRPRGYLKLTNRVGYRIRVGNYRVLYEISDKILIVKVFEVGHRKDVYTQ
jgi:mRNA interferase RelE/StbE